MSTASQILSVCLCSIPTLNWQRVFFLFFLSGNVAIFEFVHFSFPIEICYSVRVVIETIGLVNTAPMEQISLIDYGMYSLSAIVTVVDAKQLILRLTKLYGTLHPVISVIHECQYRLPMRIRSNLKHHIMGILTI